MYVSASVAIDCTLASTGFSKLQTPIVEPSNWLYSITIYYAALGDNDIADSSLNFPDHNIFSFALSHTQFTNGNKHAVLIHLICVYYTMTMSASPCSDRFIGRLCNRQGAGRWGIRPALGVFEFRIITCTGHDLN